MPPYKIIRTSLDYEQNHNFTPTHFQHFLETYLSLYRNSNQQPHPIFPLNPILEYATFTVTFKARIMKHLPLPFLFLTLFLSLFLISESYSQTVYITKSGKKYHTEKCRYAKNASAVSLSEAESRGLTPCKVCKPYTGSEIESETETGTEKNSFTGDEQISRPSSEKKQTKLQCSALTKSGNRCKRMTNHENGKCWQHQGK